VDPAGPFLSYLTPEDGTLVWNNFLQHYRLPEVERIAVRSGGSGRTAALVAALASLALLLVLLRARDTRWIWPAAAALCASAAISAVLAASALAREFTVRPLGAMEAEFVLESLLKNIYNAFYLREEEDVYDKLALTVAGKLLERVYLQQRESFAVQSAGGAQGKVNAVELLESRHRPDAGSADSLVYEARWTATGAVSHWGHTHDRTNRYHALITIAPSGELWKIVGLEVLSEERLTQSRDNLPLANADATSTLR
jgi:hypothetical protein